MIGQNLVMILRCNRYFVALEKCDLLVGHNLEFDIDMILANP